MSPPEEPWTKGTKGVFLTHCAHFFVALQVVPPHQAMSSGRHLQGTGEALLALHLPRFHFCISLCRNRATGDVSHARSVL